MAVQTPKSESMSLPKFELPTVQGETFSSGHIALGRPAVVMFICNHCPYVKAIEDRLIELGHELKKINVPLIAICSNDADAYPEDSLESLRSRAREKKYPFVYLHDETQEVARQFGAVCTPDFFVFDSKHQLAYRGRLDDSWKDASRVTRRELLMAVQDLVNHKPISIAEVPSMGCSIKWK